MSASIWTQSNHDSSIFSYGESYLSSITQWSTETPDKLYHELSNGFIHDEQQQKPNKLIGRPPNRWTTTRLRKLVKLYLLTELEIDGIIDSLRTEDFQPCKRNVQEKLKVLLQAQPRTIRPKSDANRERRQQLGRRRCIHRPGSNFTTIKNLDFVGTVDPRELSWERWHATHTNRSPTDVDFAWTPNTNLPTTTSNLLAPQGYQQSEDFISNSERFESESSQPGTEKPMNFWNHPQTLIPEIGFDSNFGLAPLLPSSNSNHLSSISEYSSPMMHDAENASAFQHLNNSRTRGTVSSPSPRLSPPSERLAINSTYTADIPDDASSFLSMTDSCYGFEAMSDFNSQANTSDLVSVDTLKGSNIVLCGISPSDNDSHTSNELGPQMSDPFPSTSSISTLLSKVSLTPPSSDTSSNSSEPLPGRLECPKLLPGAFPRYCWQHICRDTLRQCAGSLDSKQCKKKRISEGKSVYRSFSVDVLARISQQQVKSTDVDEIDAFGNSILHVATTTMASSKYLISLINLGANVNALNNAGQTFLHPFKPEEMMQKADFCSLLEVLTQKSFNFSQLDHLGQSPLHLLMRPWIAASILRQVIMTLDTLRIHSQLSTARDCLGYTIVGELNLQESSESWGENEPSARNYENHPLIDTIDDLVHYEEHVDCWRTIISGLESPWFEDLNGRNGLHCIAEAVLVSAQKPLPERLMAKLNSKGLAQCDRTSIVNALLIAGVDSNNYDKRGNTPLMAFIIHSSQAQSGEQLAHALQTLLKAGSDHSRRNRQGETALHLSVKLGCRAATEVLLAAGANIHARTQDDVGILELGQKHARKHKQDGELYAQIMLCITLSASFGAVAAPTILDEWGSRCKLEVQGHCEKKSTGFAKIKNFIIKKARWKHAARR
ncbi:ankyrin [Mollisia scopiformis]|uniref:Ankyrin n=1 Tax=Mollisia scopiformis TaxID=149040 RepID=A0A132BAE5_MOLSC|nr:ankyrin [Mollisia scopiformis]KUJ08959.1 ankyrin [Mollisia scopiformis]